MRTIKPLTLAAAVLVLFCLTGCASISSAWDSTTSSIGDLFKSEKSDKPAEEKK